MIRIIGLLGMAGGFLALSPSMRQGALHVGMEMQAYLDSHSPYSYIVASTAMVGLMVLLASSAKVRR